MCKLLCMRNMILEVLVAATLLYNSITLQTNKLHKCSNDTHNTNAHGPSLLFISLLFKPCVLFKQDILVSVLT